MKTLFCCIIPMLACTLLRCLAISMLLSPSCGAEGASDYDIIGDELVQESGMENDGYWLLQKNPVSPGPKVQERTTRDVHTGQYAMHVIGINHGDGFRSPVCLPFRSNETYRVSFWYKVIQGELYCILAHGNNTAGLVMATLEPGATWQHYETIVKETAGGPHGNIGLVTTGAGEFYVDDVSIRRVMKSSLLSQDDRIPYKQINPLSPLAEKKYSVEFLFPDNLAETLRVDFPVVNQEWMPWKHSPLTSATTPWWFWWGYPERLQPGSYWRRHLRLASYPYLGPYTTLDPRVMQWHLNQAKHAGLKALGMELFDCYDTGEFVDRDEAAFANAVRIAGEMGYFVFPIDQTMFFTQKFAPKIQDKDKIVYRFANLLQKHGKQKGWLKIKGAPVVLTRFSDNKTPRDISEVLRRVEETVGYDVYWIHQKPYGEGAGYCAIKEIDGVQGPYLGEFLFQHKKPADKCKPGEEFRWKEELGNYDWAAMDKRLQEFGDRVHKGGKDFWVWITPSFDSRSQWSHTVHEYYPDAHYNGLHGEVFLKWLYLAKQAKADYAIITSWNCYGENTPIEPVWDRDGYAGDPFFYLKMIAKVQGKRWKEPPKPPKEIVDPLLWWKVFGIDKNGPLIPRAEIRMGDLIVDVEDNATVPEKLYCTRNGDAYYRLLAEGFQAEGMKLLNPDNAQVIKKHGIYYLQPVKGALKFAIEKSFDPDKKAYLILRYDGNADPDARMISYPSIIDDYQDPLGKSETHKGWLPRFWTVDREEKVGDNAKITIEALPHFDPKRNPLVIEIRMPVNLVGLMQRENGRTVTQFSDIEGLRKRFRQPLWPDLLLGDVMVLSGVDQTGNIGFPITYDVTHLGY